MKKNKCIVFWVTITVLLSIVLVLGVFKEKNKQAVRLNNVNKTAEDLLAQDRQESPNEHTTKDFKGKYTKLLGEQAYYDYSWGKFKMYKDVLPGGARDTVDYGHDFNGDGINERILLYFLQDDNQKDAYGKLITKDYLVVYRYDNQEDAWVKDFADTTTESESYFDFNNFYKSVDADGDGKQEAVISKVFHEVGTFTQKYILKWNGKKVVKIDFPPLESVVNKYDLTKFLDKGKNQVFGHMDLLEGQDHAQGHIFICDPKTSCMEKDSGVGALGKLIFHVKLTDEEWQMADFTVDK